MIVKCDIAKNAINFQRNFSPHRKMFTPCSGQAKGMSLEKVERKLKWESAHIISQNSQKTARFTFMAQRILSIPYVSERAWKSTALVRTSFIVITTEMHARALLGLGALFLSDRRPEKRMVGQWISFQVSTARHQANVCFFFFSFSTITLLSREFWKEGHKRELMDCVQLDELRLNI